ncbi:MAG: serine/threonine-protein kinase, partial [Myxococcota bacterium]
MDRNFGLVDEHLNEFVVLGQVAEVFRAKRLDTPGFDKFLAIKRILPNLAEDNEFIQMFIDEAKITVQLNHRNICQIYELGRLEDSHYIVMEFISGRDILAILNRLRRERRIMSVGQAAYLVHQMALGLDSAHRKTDAQGSPLNIIHRDVSPQNVLVSYTGEVKIIDFGIAKAASRSSKTQAGVLKGKFGYMS